MKHRLYRIEENDIPEESGHFRFLRAACLANIKGSVGLILAKARNAAVIICLFGFYSNDEAKA